jgi:flagellar protein FlgJ
MAGTGYIGGISGLGGALGLYGAAGTAGTTAKAGATGSAGAVGSAIAAAAAGVAGAQSLPGLSGQSGGTVASALDSIGKAEEDSFEAKLQLAMTSQDEKELKDACVQFEELMLGIMYKQMKATVQRSTLTDADPGRETFEQWQDEALMKEIAKNGSFGLADMMYKQLSKRMKNAYDFEDGAE